MNRNTELVQARMPHLEVQQLDADASILGLTNRSEAIRQGIRLLHQHAREVALGQSYDDYYGDSGAPISELAAIGDVVAAETIAERG